MILALLLQVSLFRQYTELASAQLKVKGVYVEEGVVTYGKARNLAWIKACVHPQGYGCGSMAVIIAHDVTSTAPPEVLQYLAYHEVCHLKLGHNLGPIGNMELAHNHAWSCMSRALGVTYLSKLKASYDLYSVAILKMRAAQFGWPALQ
jgi:hypothetical protein